MKKFTVLHKQHGAIANPKQIAQLFNSLHDGKYLVEINAYDKRSDAQNRYYFGLVVPLIQKGIEDLGTELTKEETHEFLKSKFNTEELQGINKETGELFYETIPRSTTALNKEDFSKYTERIQQWAAQILNIEIPDPGVQTAFEYDN